MIKDINSIIKYWLSSDKTYYYASYYNYLEFRNNNENITWFEIEKLLNE